MRSMRETNRIEIERGLRERSAKKLLTAGLQVPVRVRTRAQAVVRVVHVARVLAGRGSVCISDLTKVPAADDGACERAGLCPLGSGIGLCGDVLLLLVLRFSNLKVSALQHALLWFLVLKVFFGLPMRFNLGLSVNF